MPVLCIENGLHLDVIPDILQNLNWLELLLLRRVRPMMVIFVITRTKFFSVYFLCKMQVVPHLELIKVSEVL